MIIVQHRSDGLLQRTTSEVREESRPSYATLYTLPAHQALVAFVDQKLATQTFESLEELNEALEQWQSFYYGMHRKSPSDDWRQLYVNEERGVLAVRTNGLGGNFEFGVLRTVKDASPTTQEVEA